MWHWWLRLTGAHGPLGWVFSVQGRWYAITSGPGIPLAGVLVWWRHQNCHVHGCWRRGKHPTEDGLYKLCPKHHPAVPDKVTAETVKGNP